MSPPDALHGEMPGFPFPGRPGGEHDEPLLDKIFDGRVIPPDAPREMHDLERMLAALAGPAEPGELAGEAAARAAFSRHASPAGISPRVPRPALHRLPRRPVTHRLSRRPARPRARRRMGLAAALGTAAALLVSTAAAYAGMLPGPIQQAAHVTFGAPAPHHAGSGSPAPPGPHRDAGHGPGPVGQPAPQPGRPASTGPAHGRADAAKPGHGRPPAGPPSSCEGPPGIAPGSSPPIGPRDPHCGNDVGKPSGRAVGNPHRTG